MNKEELRKECQSLSNEELFAIVRNPIRYTEWIVTAVKIEIDSRGLSKEEVRRHRRRLNRITGNITDDISLSEKILSFIIFIPRINYFVRREFRKGGFVLKIRQTALYSSLGFILFTSTFILGRNRLSIPAALFFWVLTFVPTYLFDIYYNRPRVMRNLAKRARGPEEDETNKLPKGLE